MPDMATNDNEMTTESNALKAIEKTDDHLRVGNYLVLFGGRDLEGIASRKVNDDGTRGEFFTKATQFDSAYTDTGTLYVDWEHGVEPDPGGPTRDDVLGVVDWKSAKVDDKGLWVERVLSRRNAYMQYLERLIDEGLIGNSSEAVAAQVEVKANGEIARWPLKRDTLTVSPMEPRMLSENALAALKGLADVLPGVKAVTDPVSSEAAQEAGGEPVATATEAGVTVHVHVHQDNQKPTEKAKTTEDVNMDENTNVPAQKAPDIDAIIAKALSDYEEKRAKAEAERIAAEKAEAEKALKTPGFLTTEDEADRAAKGNPYRTFGEFLMAVKGASQNPTTADQRLYSLRSGDPADEGGYSVGKALGSSFVGTLTGASLAHRGMKAPTGLNVADPAEGGFLVGTDRAGGLLARVYNVGQLLQRVDMVGVSANSNGMTFNAEDETSRANGSRRGGIRGYWLAEGGSFTGSQPKFRQMELKLKKAGALVYCTDELLADAGALESWVMQNLPEELRFTVENAIFNGDGVGKPLGILQSGCLVSVAKETGQAADTVVAENISKMYARRWVGANDYVWLINQDVMPQLMHLTLDAGTAGYPLFLPPGGWSGSPYATLLGRPVLEIEYADTVGDLGDIVLASMSQYQMIEKGGVESASSIHVNFTTGEQVFRFVYRCDGQPKWNSALTPLNSSNTVSPFVALAARA